MADPLFPVVKWSVPLAMASTIIGGSAWLTSTHNATVENTRQLRQLQNEFKQLSKESSFLNVRLGRIEEKIDFIVRLIEKKHTHRVEK